MNRSDVMKQFELSVNQASADLNRYIGLAPDIMVYDRSAPTYVRGPEYAAQYLVPDASCYFALLRFMADRLMDSHDIWIAGRPAYDARPTTARRVKPITLRSIVGTTHYSEAMETVYQSFSRSEPSWRWTAPHAIGFDGFRWHIWASCKTDEIFKDFLFSVVLQSRGVEANGATNVTDADWKGHVALEITPTLNSPKARRK